MSKRKAPPIALISIVGVLVVLSVVVNASGFLQDPGRFFRTQAPPETTAPTPSGKSADAEAEAAKGELTQALSKANSGARTRGGRPMPEEEGMVGGNPPNPIIVLRTEKAIRPATNDTNISGQWYREESRQAKRARELAARRNAADQ